MSTGVLIVLGLAAIGLASLAFLLPGLLDELRARRTLTRARGVVEHVEFSKPGRPSGARATVGFEDVHGQTRRFTTPWDEAVYSPGDTVAVGYRTEGKGQPRVLTVGGLLQHVLRVAIAAAVAIAAIVVLARTGLNR